MVLNVSLTSKPLDPVTKKDLFWQSQGSNESTPILGFEALKVQASKQAYCTNVGVNIHCITVPNVVYNSKLSQAYSMFTPLLFKMEHLTPLTLKWNIHTPLPDAEHQIHSIENGAFHTPSFMADWVWTIKLPGLLDHVMDIENRLNIDEILAKQKLWPLMACSK